MSVQETIWNYFLNKGFTPQAISGIMGNIDKECDFLPNRVQINNLYTDAQYTAMVDNGNYQNFPYDQLGYGIVQWTYSVFKQDLLTKCKNAHKSISDLGCQLEQLYSHLQSENILNKIKNLTSIEKATTIFMLEFEKPKDQSEEAQLERIKLAKKWFNIFQQKQGGNNKMKYSQSNPPLMCMMTHSTCYQQTNKMQVRGVLWHSTGANNKTLKRYVQPSREDPNYSKLMMMIGQNTGGNDWNSISVQAGLNAWIGTLSDGTVAAVQTMPWDYKPWGCGSGPNGSCNNGWIQFEICEDSLNDSTYFEAVYKEACELTAYLCKGYNINPLGNVNGIPTILCHQDSYKLGLGTNHSDVYHWFNRYGKTMDNVRQDVADLLGGNYTSSSNQIETSNYLKKGMEDNPQVKAMQQALQKFGYKIIDDGDFGPATENALKDYQQKHSLTPNGIFGPETFTSMKMEIAKLPKTTTISSKYNDVMLGSSSKDENGNYTGGQGGDQTGKEVYILNWYGKNWTSVLRPKDSALAERIATACEKGCLNDNIGYSQSTRNTLLAQAKLVGLDLAKISTPCNCDCSSFVSTCCVCAGLPESLFFPYGNGCTTWTIADACLQSGQFTQLTDSIYLNQKNYLKRGDILLNRNSHVVIVLSNGSAVPVETIVQEQSENNEQINVPYLVRVIVPALNVRAGSSNSTPITAQVRLNEVYTIVAEEGGFGKLKSGVGWIDLRYVQKK